MRTAELLTFTSLAVGDWFGWIPVVALAAIMAVSSSGEVSTLQTYASAHSPRQLVQFHVEAAFARVKIAVAH